MPGAPTGTVTFLFTDVEGSTACWESSAEAVEVAMARYEEILEVILKAHRGYLFKTVGRAFCCVFSAATEVLEVALSLRSKPKRRAKRLLDPDVVAREWHRQA